MFRTSTRLASSPVSLFGGGDRAPVGAGEAGCVAGAWAANSDHERGPIRLAIRAAEPTRKGRDLGDIVIAPRMAREAGIRSGPRLDRLLAQLAHPDQFAAFTGKANARIASISG